MRQRFPVISCAIAFAGASWLAACSSSSNGDAGAGGSNAGQGGISASQGGTSSPSSPAGGQTTSTGGKTGSSGGGQSAGGQSTTASGGHGTALGGQPAVGGQSGAAGANPSSGGQTGPSGGAPDSGANAPAGTGGSSIVEAGVGEAGGYFPSSCLGNTFQTADPSKPGPYPVTADKNVGPKAGVLPDPVYGSAQQAFNVYRPTTLGQCHPIILWGNGHGDNPEQNPPLCVYSGTMYCGSYKTLLDQLASHGFVVIASLSTDVGSPDATTGLLPQLVGMNWIVEQNDDPTSPYYQHLDVSRIGATGHSDGAFATSSAVGSDPHVMAIATMAGATPTPKLHEPALFLCGGQDTAVPCSTIQTAFDAVTTTPVMMAENPTASHGSWIGSIDDPYQLAVTGWMRVHLMNDTSLRSTFYGANCGDCTTSASQPLEVQRKNMDQ